MKSERTIEAVEQQREGASDNLKNKREIDGLNIRRAESGY